MRKLLASLLMGASLVSFAGDFNSSLTDVDGYPILYVRGYDFGNWDCRVENKLVRVGQEYTITVPSLSSEFKISDRDWQVEYGAENANNAITSSVSMTGVKAGHNFKAPEALSNVVIKLKYDPSNKSRAQISFTVDEVTPPVNVEGISGTLPVLYINVYDEAGNYNNEIIDYNLPHKNYFSGSYWLDLNGCDWMAEMGATSIGSEAEPLPLEIKARGNWSRIGFSKKPFKLKLGKKQSLLGLSNSKHFAIIAHADDNCGYLRNFTGFNLGRRMDLPWTPSQQPVEVVINGDYRGLYFLTESIRVESQRVNITELNDGETDFKLATGGYLVELDNYDEDSSSQIRLEEKGQYPGFKDKLRITFDTPEVYSEEQRMFINDQFVAMNNLVGTASNDLWGYIDLDDLARYYLVCEIVSHVEAFHGSTYMFRDRGENQKWHFSPLWDFGNAFVGPTDGFIYDNAPYGMTWIGSITYNEKFNNKVRDTWKWFMTNKYDGIEEDMTEICNRIAAAAVADHKRWANAPVPANGSAVCDNSNISEKLSNAKNHLRSKVNWLKNKFGNFENMVYDVPGRDDTPCAPLPSYIPTGVEKVTETMANDGSRRFYTMQGVAVETPVNGEIYIMVDSEGSRKVIFK